MTLNAFIAANCIVVTKATKSRSGAQNAKSGVMKNFEIHMAGKVCVFVSLGWLNAVSNSL
jgi:hypothetical protein